jgi:methylated-DNA-[protein]-cysteine S-methyltransferase
MTALARFRSPVGTLDVEVTDAGVCGVTVSAPARSRPRAPVTAASRAHLDAALAWLAEYFAGKVPGTPPPLDLRGSDFDRTVWAALVAIPYGETRTYGELAREIGAPGAARAVGAANGRNPVCVVVPCHRVVAAGGHLGGYSGGLDVKRWLLAHEAGHAAALRPEPQSRSASTAMLSPVETGTGSRAGRRRPSATIAGAAAGKLAASLRTR